MARYGKRKKGLVNRVIGKLNSYKRRKKYRVKKGYNYSNSTALGKGGERI